MEIKSDILLDDKNDIDVLVRIERMSDFIV